MNIQIKKFLLTGLLALFGYTMFNEVTKAYEGDRQAKKISKLVEDIEETNARKASEALSLMKEYSIDISNELLEKDVSAVLSQFTENEQIVFAKTLQGCQIETTRNTNKINVSKGFDQNSIILLPYLYEGDKLINTGGSTNLGIATDRNDFREFVKMVIQSPNMINGFNSSNKVNRPNF